MIISWSCWIQYLFAPSGSLLKSSRFWEPKEQTLWRSSKCSDPIHLCMSTHFFKYVLPPENGSSGCFAGCPSVALPSFILFIIGSQTSSVNVQHGSFNTHITLIAFLLWMNECGPKKCLLLVCRRRYLQPQAPRHNSWSYESRPRIPLRPRPHRGFEATGLKRHTIVLPEAAYATVV